MLETLLEFLLIVFAVFLIVLVLIQRGKGGGLAGALGGMGGQSAFGTKAGDLFTKITVVVAALWIALCIFTVWSLAGVARGPLDTSKGGAAGQQRPGSTAPASTEKGPSGSPAPPPSK